MYVLTLSVTSDAKPLAFHAMVGISNSLADMAIRTRFTCVVPLEPDLASLLPGDYPRLHGWRELYSPRSSAMMKMTVQMVSAIVVRTR
jgi:hypothetical protein